MRKLWAHMDNKEPELIYTILCDEVKREDNGKWMLLGLFENIGVAGLPAMHSQCFIFNKWLGAGGKWTQQTRIVDGSNNVVVKSDDLPFELNGPNATFTAVQIFQGLPLQKEETLWVEVLLGDEVKKRYPLQIAIVKSQ